MINKKVVILDDDKEFLEELAETLSLSGYEPIAISDTDGFADIVVKTQPAVILMDLKMPKKTGLQMAYELKEYTETAHVPIIAMSGFMNENYTTLITLCGIKKFLKKPFNPLDIIMEIEEVLAKGE